MSAYGTKNLIYIDETMDKYKYIHILQRVKKILEVYNSPSVTEKINSVHNHLQHVIHARGGPTKY